jgi:hypothetical protein
MMTENDEILFSELADGELHSDQANELLLNVLDAPAQREKLKAMLRLRQGTVAWRTKTPQRPVMVVSERPRTFRRGRIAWRVSGLAVAACVGGLLVLAGVWTAGRLGQGPQTSGPNVAASTVVTPEQMQQVAKVFALHESVAGPLAWYAADDQNIRLASAGGAEASQPPIGVLLKLDSATAGAPARTLVIVCRNDQPAVIELPPESSGRSGLRLYLAPRRVNGHIDMRYAIAVDGQSQETPLASLSGERRLGTSESSLGQLTMGDRVMNIEAAAWPMQQERK